MKLERERSDDAEVAAAAADRPEQVRVRVGGRRPDLAVRAHDLRLDQVVASRGRTSGAASHSRRRASGPATPVSETTPPGAARPKAWVSRSTSPHSAPPCTCAIRRSGRPGRPHRREVDEHAAVDRRQPGDRVPTTANATVRPCARAKLTASTTSAVPEQLHDQIGRAGVHRVEDRADLGVTRIARSERGAAKLLAKFIEGPVCQCAGRRRRARGHVSPLLALGYGATLTPGNSGVKGGMR